MWYMNRLAGEQGYAVAVADSAAATAEMAATSSEAQRESGGGGMAASGFTVAACDGGALSVEDGRAAGGGIRSLALAGKAGGKAASADGDWSDAAANAVAAPHVGESIG